MARGAGGDDAMGMAHSSPLPRRLTRSRSDKFVGGVAGGLGAYFDVDPVLVRVAFAVSTLFSGAGLVAYLVMCAVLPTDDEPSTLVPA
jgi:phage shock protein PspC (stress-responsive transcriptional regulator)